MFRAVGCFGRLNCIGRYECVHIDYVLRCGVGTGYRPEESLTFRCNRVSLCPTVSAQRLVAGTKSEALPMRLLLMLGCPLKRFLRLTVLTREAFCANSLSFSTALVMSVNVHPFCPHDPAAGYLHRV